MILTPGGRDKNELPSGTDPTHWEEQQNLVSQPMRRSKTDAWTLSVRWTLDSISLASIFNCCPKEREETEETLSYKAQH